MKDYSKLIAILREDDPSKDARLNYDETTMEWIERMFSLDYYLPC